MRNHHDFITPALAATILFTVIFIFLLLRWVAITPLPATPPANDPLSLATSLEFPSLQQNDSPSLRTETEKDHSTTEETNEAAADQEDHTGQIELNSATAEQLDTLPGIGPVKAAAILEYRQQIGGFTRKEQLLNVDGIGQKTYDKLKDLVYVE